MAVSTSTTAANGVPRANERSVRDAQTCDLLARAGRAFGTRKRRLMDEAVEINLDMAESIGLRYSGRGIERDDLTQVAYLGLVQATRRFDPAQGADFASFAVPTITGEVKRHFRDHGWVVRPPRRVQELSSAVSAAQSELAQRQSGTPSSVDVAKHLDVDATAVREAQGSHACYAAGSIDRRYGQSEDGDADRPMAEILGDDDRGFDRADAMATLGTSCRRLTARDRRIVYLRFFRGWTQKEIADELGVTQMQVSRLLSRILRDLRRDLTGA